MPTGIYKHKPCSEKTKKKMSLSHKGKPTWNKGKKCPQMSKALLKSYQSGCIRGFQKGHKFLGDLSKPNHFQKGHKVSQEQIDRFRQISTGENNYGWKGNNVGYRALHSYIRRHKGKPEICEHCKITYKEKKICWANKDHKYKRDLNNWISLCYKCHGKYDKKLNLRKHIRRGT